MQQRVRIIFSTTPTSLRKKDTIKINAANQRHIKEFLDETSAESMIFVLLGKIQQQRETTVTFTCNRNKPIYSQVAKSPKRTNVLRYRN